MSIVQTIGRMLLGGSIRRALWRSPKALLIAAALVGLALMSIGTVRAASIPSPCPSSTPLQCDRGQAYAYASQQKCWDDEFVQFDVRTHLNHASNQSPPYYSSGASCYRAGQGPGSQSRVVAANFYYRACPVDAPWNPETGTCGTPNTCPDRPNLGPSAWSGYDPSNASICKDSCSYTDIGGLSVGIVIDGVEYTYAADWGPTGAQCSASGDGVSSPAPADADGDGTSDGFDGSPNNPGSGGGGGADGLGQPEDGHCGGEGQPACGENGSGSGNGNTSGGGGNCASPPSSTGDPILAQIAYQTWATRCAIEGKGTVEGNGDSDAQPEWTKGNAPAVPGGDDEGDIAGAKRFGIGIGPGLLDDADIFGGGTCPQFSFQIAGTTISSADYPQWCNVVAIMRALILIFGAFTALRILMGSE